MRVRLVIGFCCSLLLNADAWPQERFVERPGALTFSGQMIVRPLQGLPQARIGTTFETFRARATARLQAHLIEHVRQTDEFIVRVPPGDDENSYADRLLATGDYEYVVPNWICHPTATVPNDGGYFQQWHHAHLQTAQAWDINTGSDIVIAIVDGGVLTDHPDLAQAMVPGYNAKDRLAEVDGGQVTDLDGHGTHVAGLAGALGNNGTHVVGIGWNFRIMPIRYYNGTGGGFLSDVLDGARWAVDHGADIVNVSQTGVAFGPVQTTGAYIAGKGGLLFYAAGNDGRDLDWFDWDDVVVVGGTDPNDAKTSCSAYGQAVDLFAPGEGLLSTYLNNGLGLSGCGTSGATPLAAGTAALIWSSNPCLTHDEVLQVLLSSCHDLGPPGDDPAWGWGRVDPPEALSNASTCGDCNANGSVDPGDGLLLATCLTGPDVATTSGCECGDLAGDNDLDLHDLAAVQVRVAD